MLEMRTPDHLIADYLTIVVRDGMELRPDRKAAEDVAAMLRELYDIES
jgi:hypothetical protein